MTKIKKKKIQKIVVIGGGTGTFTVLTALRNYSVPLHLTAIVTMADSGGSTGRLRDQYGVLPPGDIRRALVALSDASQTLRKLFNYRFETGDLKDHSFGNIFLTALEKMTGNFGSAVKEAARVLNINGEVIPVTLDNINLCAELADGSIIRGETNIDIPKHDPSVQIKKVWLEPVARLNPEAKKAILAADMLIIGPGDLYTSLIPNLLVKGVTATIRKSRAEKVYVCNLMTKFGETHGFKAQNFINVVEKYLGHDVLDYIVFNSKKPSVAVLERYRKESAYFVDIAGLDLQSKRPQVVLADLIESGQFIRHDHRKKLAKTLLSLIKTAR